MPTPIIFVHDGTMQITGSGRLEGIARTPYKHHGLRATTYSLHVQDFFPWALARSQASNTIYTYTDHRNLQAPATFLRSKGPEMAPRIFSIADLNLVSMFELSMRRQHRLQG